MKTFLLIIFLILGVSNCNAETIGLDGIFKLVRDNHPLFQKERVNVDIEPKRRDATLGAQDWQLGGLAQFDRKTDVLGGLSPKR